MTGPGSTGGTVRVDPNRLEASAGGLDAVAAALRAAAEDAPRPSPSTVPGFATPALAADLAVRWAAAVHAEGAAARAGAEALRSAAATWRSTDADVAAAFGRRTG